MARISKSDKAPEAEVQFSLGPAAAFSLGGADATYETDDRDAIGEAIVHPWLNVEFDAPAEQAPEDAPPVEAPFAIEAGRDQSDERPADERAVAETFAEADTDVEAAEQANEEGAS